VSGRVSLWERGEVLDVEGEVLADGLAVVEP
jgi:hypothetical protein